MHIYYWKYCKINFLPADKTMNMCKFKHIYIFLSFEILYLYTRRIMKNLFSCLHTGQNKIMSLEAIEDNDCKPKRNKKWRWAQRKAAVYIHIYSRFFICSFLSFRISIRSSLYMFSLNLLCRKRTKPIRHVHALSFNGENFRVFKFCMPAGAIVYACIYIYICVCYAIRIFFKFFIRK